MTKIKDITQYLESFAPSAYQEDYDNAGLITGDQQKELTGIIISLDCTEAVIDEAVRKGCNLVIAHHPIVFRGLKKLTGKNYVERTVIKAVKNDIAVFAAHTNLDHIAEGVNKEICNRLGLVDTQILRPKTDTLMQLTTFIPLENTREVLAKLHESGAGMIGKYKNCSFRSEGTGTFLPSENANPALGKVGITEEVHENRVEVVFPGYLKNTILSALFQSHPYEEVAYFVNETVNINKEVGAGMIGRLPKPEESSSFIQKLKTVLKAKAVRHTALEKDKITTVAVCGGSGSFLLRDAVARQADIFVSGDFKYHEFFDADGKIIIADVGHYESEQFTKDIIYNKISEKFTNIALHFTEVNTNPILYA